MDAIILGFMSFVFELGFFNGRDSFQIAVNSVLTE